MDEVKYFNFPIQLLDGFMIDSKKVLSDIIDYAIYSHSLKLESDTELQSMNKSAKFFKTTLGNPNLSLKNGKQLYNTIPENSPKVGLNITIYWDFYNNEKTEFDKICLLMFLGIKSVLGHKPYCKITNLYLWSRMDGKAKTVTDIFDLSDEVRKYANEYQTKNIKSALRNNWGLITYSRYCRGFYVSFDITLEELILNAEKKRISTKEKQYKKLESETLKKVLEQLNATRP